MFNKRLQGELRTKQKVIDERLDTNDKDIIKLRDSIDKKLELFRFDLTKFENAFRKEILDEITTKFFDTLDKIFRTSKEISLISTLANQVNGKDMANLRSQLLQPILEARWREEKNKKGERIINKGAEIIEKRDKLHKDIIDKERRGERVDNLKIKLEIYNEIVGGLK